MSEQVEDRVSLPCEAMQDGRLSYAARGVLAYLLSKPRGERVRISHIMEQGKIGRDKASRLYNELKEYGYIVDGVVQGEPR